MDISGKVDAYLTSEFGNLETSIFRDLSLNLKKLLEDSSLEPMERFQNLFSIAVTLENDALASLAKSSLTELGASPEAIRECAEIAGIMGMNNVYYKFKTFLSPEVAADYQRAGLRMNSLAKNVTSKKEFEMMSLAVSVVNACPVCVASHEKTVRSHGASADNVHDVARLAAVCKGLASLKKAQKYLG